MDLELKNIHFTKNNKEILKGVDLKIKRNEKVALIGPSGAGKTTLLKILSLTESISDGEILINSEKVKSNNLNKFKKKMAVVFQQFNLFLNMNVLENLTIAPIHVKKLSERIATERALSLLQKMGLENKARSSVGSLSGGQKQRVAIARALLMEPEVIFFDEPTSALDPEKTIEFKNLLDLVCKDKTVILVSHHIGFVKKYANKVVFLDEGKILENENAEVFFKSPNTKRAKNFLENF